MGKHEAHMPGPLQLDFLLIWLNIRLPHAVFTAIGVLLWTGPTRVVLVCVALPFPAPIVASVVPLAPIPPGYTLPPI